MEMQTSSDDLGACLNVAVDGRGEVTSCCHSRSSTVPCQSVYIPHSKPWWSTFICLTNSSRLENQLANLYQPPHRPRLHHVHRNSPHRQVSNAYTSPLRILDADYSPAAATLAIPPPLLSPKLRHLQPTSRRRSSRTRLSSTTPLLMQLPLLR